MVLNQFIKLLVLNICLQCLIIVTFDVFKNCSNDIGQFVLIGFIILPNNKFSVALSICSLDGWTITGSKFCVYTW